MQGNLDKNIKISDREILIRKIIKKISDTKDIDEIKNYIITSIGQALNAMRCFLGEHHLDKNGDPVPKNQYLCSSEVKFFKGFIKKNKLIEETTHRETFIYDVEKYLKENNFDENSEMFQGLMNYNVKSGFSVPVNYNNNFLGALVLQYDKAYAFNEEDIDFVRTVADHLGIAINQCNLYYLLEKKMEIEKLLGNIITTVRRTIDLDEMFTIICDEVGKAFNADRASIIQCNDAKDFTKWSLKREYTACETVKTHKAINVDRGISLFWVEMLHKRGNKSHYIENIPEANLPEPLNSSYRKLEAKTMLGISIEKGDDKWGGLFLSKTRSFDKWTQEEIKFLEVVSDQIYIAIKQAESYTEFKKQAERESLLRKTVETIRNTLDINEIKNLFVNIIGQFFNADRVLFSEFNSQKNMYDSADKYSEYLSSPKEKSFIGYDWSNPEICEYIQPLIEKQEFNIYNLDEYLQQNPKNPAFVSLFRDASVQSSYNIPILYLNEIMGYFCIEFTQREYRITEQELEFLRSIINQVGIAIHQAKLYKTVQETAKRETLIRETILSLLSSISSMNIKEVFKSIVTEIGKLFEADRCFFAEYDPDNNDMFPQEEYKEYNSDKTIKPAYSRENTKEELSALTKINVYQKQILKVENTAEVNFPETTKTLLKDLSIKSFIGLPITYGETALGTLVLHYVKDYKKFSQNEIDTLHTIATQSGIIINQAKLYKKVQETAEKEKMLAEIMAVIKSNLKIDEIFLIICSLLTNFYDVNRIMISKLDIERIDLNILKECCKKNTNKNEGKLSLKSKEYFYEKIIKNKNLIINNIEEANNPKYFLKDLALMKIKALMMVPIYINENEQGAIIIQDKKKKNWKQEDVSFLSRIADYISIAIKESNLYNQSEFISNVSHELKTPLSVINGYSGALLNLEKPDCETTNRFLHIIKNNTQRLNKLIDNLLFISTIEKKLDNKTLAFEEIKVVDLIENSIQLCYEKIKLKNIKIEKNIKNLVIKRANTILLQQLIINLITNAVNSSEEHSIISLKTIKNDKEILISIEDNGCGIKKEHLPNIFERFYRIDKSRSRETGGIGLGLSISKLIGEIHGGYITVESVFGKGSAFILHLPE